MQRLVMIVTAAIGSAVVYWGLPEQVDELGRRASVLFVVAAVFWAGQVLPLYITSLGVVIASILALAENGGLATSGGIDASAFLRPFASNVIMLFFGGLVLSQAFSKQGLDRAIAAWVFYPLADRPRRLVYAVLGITAFLSMWMSNTATTAMMLSIVGSLTRDRPERDRFATALVLAVAMGANIGGIGTPIGTPPNAIAMGALQRAGFEVTFFRWMLMAVPLLLVLLPVAGALVCRLYNPASGKLSIGVAEQPRLTRASWMTLGVLGLAVAGWLTSGLHGVTDGVIALSAAFTLAACGLVGEQEIKQIEWPVLILMWGGLTLGSALEVTGLVEHLSEIPLTGVSSSLLAGLLMAIAIGLSLFISNTATAALLVPIVLALAVPNEGLLVVLVALSCSFAMALPISTPPNALSFGTGRIQLRDLVKVGGLMAVIAVILVMAGYRVMLPLTLPVGR